MLAKGVITSSTTRKIIKCRSTPDGSSWTVCEMDGRQLPKDYADGGSRSASPKKKESWVIAMVGLVAMRRTMRALAGMKAPLLKVTREFF